MGSPAPSADLLYDVAEVSSQDVVDIDHSVADVWQLMDGNSGE